MSYNLFLPKDKLWALGLVLFMCSIIGGYVSFISYGFAKTWAVSLISGWGGLAAGLIISKILSIKNATLTLLFGIMGSVMGAYFGKKLNLLVRSSGTAIFGSYCVIKGVGSYLGGMPDENSIYDSAKSGAFNQSY